MQHKDFSSINHNSSQSVAKYMNKVVQPSDKRVLDNVLLEILTEGKRLSRKSICARLLSRMERVQSASEQKSYQTLVGQLFD